MREILSWRRPVVSKHSRKRDASVPVSRKSSNQSIAQKDSSQDNRRYHSNVRDKSVNFVHFKENSKSLSTTFKDQAEDLPKIHHQVPVLNFKRNNEEILETIQPKKKRTRKERSEEVNSRVSPFHGPAKKLESFTKEY